MERYPNVILMCRALRKVFIHLKWTLSWRCFYKKLFPNRAINICELMKYDFVSGYADMSPAERLSISVYSALVVAMRCEWYYSESKLYTELLQ